MKTLLVALALLFAPLAAHAQGCGPSNPSCIVPTAPVGTNNNQAASTAFVQGQIGATSIVTSVDSQTGAFTTGNGVDSSGKVIELTAARRTLPTTSNVTTSGHTGGFSANGSGTYTAPANTLWYEVFMVAGGGGGGAGGTGGNGGGGGGAAGSFCYSVVTTNIGTGQAYTAGAAGSASTFGTSFSFTTNAGNVGASFSGVAGGVGGTGGAAGSGCTFNIAGGDGNAGSVGILGTASGIGGTGGASFYGSGGAGAAGTAAASGVVPGSGGGGGNGAGSGAPGRIFIIEHYGT